MPLQFESEASCTEKSMKLKRVMAGKSARLKAAWQENNVASFANQRGLGPLCEMPCFSGLEVFSPRGA
jgi:hypothetical protein